MIRTLRKLNEQLFKNWEEKKRRWSLKLDEYARASSYAIHR
jgi:hypothetical protein